MEKIEEQFDEKFPSGVFNFYYKIQYIKKVKEIKQFYSSKISKLLKEIVHSMVYDCSSGDDMIESLEEIINNSEFKELI